jgi:predicted O-methyltransferase YrrM
MFSLPVGFQQRLGEIFDRIRAVDGWLSDREVECLAVLAASPTASGEILEIGTFRGRSTIVLSMAAGLSDSNHLVAVDPFILEGSKPEDNSGQPSARDLLEANLQKAGVSDRVEFHETYSQALGETWDRPIRLLWIDGDHSYEGAKADFDTFAPFLVEAGIIAFHDALHPHECVRVYREDVVESLHFWPCELCGSIGWAQYHRDAKSVAPFMKEKQELARRLRWLERIQRRDVTGLNKLRYKLTRSLVAHGRFRPQRSRGIAAA